MVVRKPASRPEKRGSPARSKARSIWDRLLERADRIPEEDLQRFPEDSSENLHHYLHGAAKQKAN